MAIEITKDNFQSEVADFKGKVLIDFWAPWCGPCRMVSPIIEEIAEENKDPSLKVCKVNVDDQPELAQEFNVMSIPMLVVMKDGKILTQSVGARPKGEILKLIAD